MIRRLSFAFAAGAMLLVAAPAIQAQTKRVTVLLNGAQEVPPVATSGTGCAVVKVDTATGNVTVTGTYRNLNGNQTLAHIHGPAPVGMNAGILVTLTGTGGTSGTFGGSGTLTPAQVTDLCNGLHYLNVHTTTSPGGEVRGQIVQAAKIPALGSAGFAALAVMLGGVGVLLLRRRAALARAT